MDYPKSVPGVGLVDGKFANEDKAIPRAGSIIPAEWGNAVTDEIRSVLLDAGIEPDEANNAQLLLAIKVVSLRQSVAVVGQSRNAAMYVREAANTAKFTADEIVLGSQLGGLSYRIANISDTFDLATDMDTGAAPVSGFVGLYRLYNPTTKAALRRIVNATAAVLPEIYSGAPAPQGFTASALVGVVPTNAAGQFAPFNLTGRTVSIPRRQSISTAVVSPGYSSVKIADIPKNAKWIGGFLGVSNNTANASFGFWVGSDANGSGETWCSGILPQPGVGSTTAFGCAVVSPQTLFYTSTSSGGTVSQNIFTTSYRF
ncbi:hypothetical protein PAP18089_01925 [Pandoraea apista]|uniref:Tail fiber protein n=1 Tax=Pandoraea apista TaxID=93218 RepID=A0A5E5P432_9BURK|nr:hypothetical protein [Pandoraea apista]VVG70953.1 hypothetical protein PAP18089_01925 [Pandoraea apista]